MVVSSAAFVEIMFTVVVETVEGFEIPLGMVESFENPHFSKQVSMIFPSRVVFIREGISSSHLIVM